MHKNRLFIIQLRHPRCVCNNEVKYIEGQNQLNLLARLQLWCQ